jgi:predicted transcriptional regulator
MRDGVYFGSVRRTQIYIDEALDRELRQTAAAEGRSAAAVIRAALSMYLTARQGRSETDDPILAMAGRFAGLPADASVEHDRDLYDERTRRSVRRRP